MPSEAMRERVRNEAVRSADTADRRRVYGWFRTHPGIVDFLLMAALWIITCAPFVPGFLTMERGDWGLLGLAAIGGYSLLVVPLAWRRTYPVLAGAIIAFACIVQWALGAPILPANIAVLFVVYSLAAFGPRWASYSGLGLALVGAVMAGLRYTTFQFSDDWIGIIISILFIWAFVGIAWLLGDLTRSRRALLDGLEDRARRLEREQQQERELAAADERSRIAREMHDIVAHSLSVIIAQADGGLYASQHDADVARAALRTIGLTGRESLSEMRRLLGVLRSDERHEVRPMPTLSNVQALLESVRAAGIAVTFEVEGRPRHAGLVQGAELAAYRVIQEALTNVMKHAGPNVAVSVDLTWEAQGLLIVILDNGRGAAASADTRGQGLGIRGMTERVGLYGGTLVAQPKMGGGFGVHASIPYAQS